MDLKEINLIFVKDIDLLIENLKKKAKCLFLDFGEQKY